MDVNTKKDYKLKKTLNKLLESNFKAVYKESKFFDEGFYGDEIWYVLKSDNTVIRMRDPLLVSID